MKAEFLQIEPPLSVGANCVRPRETTVLPYEKEKQHPRMSAVLYRNNPKWVIISWSFSNTV